MVKIKDYMPIIKFPPLTVEEAVDYLQANMPPHYETQLTAASKEDLSDLHFSLGAHASSILGLWSGNEELLESCRTASGNKDLDADDASMLIINRLWDKLQNKDNSGFAGGGMHDAKEPGLVDEIRKVKKRGRLYYLNNSVTFWSLSKGVS